MKDKKISFASKLNSYRGMSGSETEAIEGISLVFLEEEYSLVSLVTIFLLLGTGIHLMVHEITDLKCNTYNFKEISVK